MSKPKKKGLSSGKRLAKRKQWILFNLIQLMCVVDRKGQFSTKRIPLCQLPVLSSNTGHMPSSEGRKDIKLSQMFLCLVQRDFYYNLSQNIYIRNANENYGEKCQCR